MLHVGQVVIPFGIMRLFHGCLRKSNLDLRAACIGWLLAVKVPFLMRSVRVLLLGVKHRCRGFAARLSQKVRPKSSRKACAKCTKLSVRPISELLRVRRAAGFAACPPHKRGQTAAAAAASHELNAKSFQFGPDH